MTPPLIIVDARGLRCPLPVLRLARAMRLDDTASHFRLLSDDPATRAELAAWCAATGHHLTPDLQIVRNSIANENGSH